MAVQASMFAGAHTPKGRARPQVKDFMYVDPGVKKETETRTFFSKLRTKANAKR